MRPKSNTQCKKYKYNLLDGRCHGILFWIVCQTLESTTVILKPAELKYTQNKHVTLISPGRHAQWGRKLPGDRVPRSSGDTNSLPYLRISNYISAAVSSPLVVV